MFVMMHNSEALIPFVRIFKTIKEGRITTTRMFNNWLEHQQHIRAERVTIHMILAQDGHQPELCLCRDILQVRKSNEIALHKNNKCVLQSRLIKHELVLVFITYYA